jgi:hypothetical protein
LLILSGGGRGMVFSLTSDSFFMSMCSWSILSWRLHSRHSPSLHTSPFSSVLCQPPNSISSICTDHWDFRCSHS